MSHYAYLTSQPKRGYADCTEPRKLSNSDSHSRTYVDFLRPPFVFSHVMVGRAAAIQHPQGENCPPSVCGFEPPDLLVDAHRNVSARKNSRKQETFQ